MLICIINYFLAACLTPSRFLNLPLRFWTSLQMKLMFVLQELLDRAFYWPIHFQQYWGAKLTPKSGAFISYSVEPFLPSIYSHNTDATAFPPVRSKGFLPINVFFSWTDATFDNEYYDAIRTTLKVISDAARAEGQNLQNMVVYPNYAIFDTPLSTIYGSNLPSLRALKSLVDPTNVMGLAGGWKFWYLPFALHSFRVRYQIYNSVVITLHTAYPLYGQIKCSRTHTLFSLWTI